MEIIKKTLVVLILCSFIMGTVPISVLAQPNSPGNQIFEYEGPDLPDDIQYAPDQIIVKFKVGTSDDTISVINSKNKVVSSEKIMKKNPKAVENEKTKILKKHGLDRIYLLKLPKNSDVNEMVGKYNKNPDVEYAEPNYKVYVDATIPNDDYFSLLWGMHNTGQSEGTVDADIDAPEAWDITTGSSDIVVAVIDTGVDYNHPDLAANIWTNPYETLNGIDDDGNGYIDDIKGWDFFSKDNNPDDGSGHGTHCSGTIAAVGNNDIGVVGVSWNAKIMPLRFLGPDGGYTDDAISAIEYAFNNGANIMSNSWGGGGYSQALKDAISTANEEGILFVAAAGNRRQNTDRRPHYPSSYDVPNIISVAATDRYDNLASFSNYGPNSVDLGAPGVYIASTYPGNSYYYMSGTSMAAPHVAGAAALIMAQNPEMSVDDLKAKILDSVDPIDALAVKTVTGGRLNVYNALDDLENTPPVADANGPYTGTEDIPVAFSSDGSYDPDGDALTYHWDFGDDSTGTGVNPTHAYTAGGEYIVTLIVNDGKVDSEPSTTTATITEVNDPPIANAGPDQTVSVDETVEFNGSGSYDPEETTLSYAWDFDDGSTGTGVSPTHTYTAEGTYTVTLTVTDGELTDTDTLIVTVTDEPPNTMHIASIDMSLKIAGPNKNGIALVTVVDVLRNPVAGATVEGYWNDFTDDIDSGLTDASGEVKLNSDKVRNAPPGTIFTFTVNSVALDGWTYDESASVTTGSV